MTTTATIKYICFQLNTKIFYYSTYWKLFSIPRQSSGHHYIRFKTSYMKCTLISYLMGSHESYTNVKNLLQR